MNKKSKKIIISCVRTCSCQTAHSNTSVTNEHVNIHVRCSLGKSERVFSEESEQHQDSWFVHHFINNSLHHNKVRTSATKKTHTSMRHNSWNSDISTFLLVGFAWNAKSSMLAISPENHQRKHRVNRLSNFFSIKKNPWGTSHHFKLNDKLLKSPWYFYYYV